MIELQTQCKLCRN